MSFDPNTHCNVMLDVSNPANPNSLHWQETMERPHSEGSSPGLNIVIAVFGIIILLNFLMV